MYARVNPLFMGLQDVSTPSSASSVSTPSTNDQTRAFLAARAQTSTPYILSVWRASSAQQQQSLVGSFLLERMQSPHQAENGTCEYLIGGALADADHATKSCVRIEVSAEELMLQELNYRSDCSRERSLEHGDGGCVPMVIGAVAAVLELEGGGASSMDTLTLTDDSQLPELHYPGTTRAVRRTGRVSMADYSVVMHGATWYARRLGVTPVAADAEDVQQAVQVLDATATSAMPAPSDFDDLWAACFSRRVLRDPFYGPDHEQLYERARALHAQAETWRAWLRALRAELGVAFVAIAWPAVMAAMLYGMGSNSGIHGIPGIQQFIPTATYEVPTSDLLRHMDAAGLHITLTRVTDAIQRQQQSVVMRGGASACRRDIRRVLSAWQDFKRAPRPTRRLCPGL